MLREGRKKGFNREVIIINYQKSFSSWLCTCAVFIRWRVRQIRSWSRCRSWSCCLRLGVNDLIGLALKHACNSQEEFLTMIFHKGWTTSAVEGSKPIKAARVAADSNIVCGYFHRDAYTDKQKSLMKKEGKTAQELGFSRPKPSRRQGAQVNLKIRPLTLILQRKTFLCFILVR